MISGFRTIQQVLGHETKSPWLQWPTWNDFDLDAVAPQEKVLNSIEEMLITHRFCLLLGAQAHRKTVTSKALGYRLAKLGWAVWYAEAEHLNIQCAFEEVSNLDNPQMLFILDDCHKDPDRIDWFIRGLFSLRNASFLFVSRPTVPMNTARGESAVDLLRKSGNIIQMEVDNNLVKSIIDYELKNRVGEELAHTCNNLVSKDDINNLCDFMGRDLEMMNWLLRSWNPVGQQPLAEVIDKTRLYTFIVTKRLNSIVTRSVLLPLTAIYQFDVSVQIKFLLPVVEQLIREGLVLVNPSMPENRGIFVRLSHPSLAKLYLNAAEWHDMLEYVSLDAYLCNQLCAYIKSKPINYYGLFRGLYYAKRLDLMEHLFSDNAVRGSLMSISSQPDTHIYRLSGLVGFVARRDVTLAKALLDNYTATHDSTTLCREFLDLNPDQRKLVNYFLRRVSDKTIKYFYSLLPLETILDEAKNKSFADVLSVLQILNKCRFWKRSDISNAFMRLDPAFLLNGLRQKITPSQLKFLINHIEGLPEQQYREVVGSINLDMILGEKDKITWPFLSWLVRMLARASLIDKIEEVIRRIGQSEFIKIVKEGKPSKVCTMISSIRIRSQTLCDMIITWMGFKWFTDIANGVNVAIPFKVLGLLGDTELQEQFLTFLDRETLKSIMCVSPVHMLLDQLERLQDINKRVADEYLNLLTEPILIDRIRKGFTLRERKRFFFLLSTIDSSLCSYMIQQLGIRCS